MASQNGYVTILLCCTHSGYNIQLIRAVSNVPNIREERKDYGIDTADAGQAVSRLQNLLPTPSIAAEADTALIAQLQPNLLNLLANLFCSLGLAL